MGNSSKLIRKLTFKQHILRAKGLTDFINDISKSRNTDLCSRKWREEEGTRYFISGGWGGGGGGFEMGRREKNSRLAWQWRTPLYIYIYIYTIYILYIYYVYILYMYILYIYIYIYIFKWKYEIFVVIKWWLAVLGWLILSIAISECWSDNDVMFSSLVL